MSLIPGPDYKSEVLAEGPPLPPLGQLGLDFDDFRRESFVGTIESMALAMVAAHLEPGLVARAAGLTTFCAEDDPSVSVSVDPALVPAMLSEDQQNWTTTYLRSRAIRDMKGFTDAKRQEKTYARAPDPAPLVTIRTPRLPHHATTARLATFVSPVHGINIRSGLEEAANAKETTRRRREAHRNRTPGRKSNAPVKKRLRVTKPKLPRGPRVITSATQ